MSNSFNFAPGRVKFEQVVIRKRTTVVDITALVVEANIYSSLIDPTSIAKFMLIDAKNILSNLPIEAGDLIELTVSYPDIQHTHMFTISKINDIVDYERQKTYVLECVSRFAFAGFYTTISKHYKGTTSEIAQTIFKENTNERIGSWEPSVGIQNLIIPNWNILKTLQWLAKRSTSVIDTTRFYFFQDGLQRYHFAPIERFREAYKKMKVLKFTFGKNNQLVRGIANSEAAMLTVLDIKFHDSFDFEAQVNKGRFGGTRFQTDLNTKTMSVLKYNAWDSFDKNRALNSFPSWSRNNQAANKMAFDHVATNMTPGIELNKVSNISNIRETSIDVSQFVDITIHGNPNVDVGQVIELEILSPEPKTDTIRDKFDMRWSGKYYVVAKRDMYTKEEYRTALTLSKESTLTKEVIV